VRVRGTLTLDGKPVAGKSIRFVPEENTPGVGAGANTGLDGTFELIAVRPGATRDTLGVPPGKYKVAVTEPIFPIEFEVSATGGEGPAPAIGLPTVLPRGSIPGHYHDAESSPLRIEITPDSHEQNIELTSQPPPRR
jgi:hypothetical protein